MVDRSYLPYRAAREYQDRRMMKWMGFFLSEHTTALNTAKVDVDETIEDEATIAMLLNQAYLYQLDVIIWVKKNHTTREKVIGQIAEVSQKWIDVREKGVQKQIRRRDICHIALAEGEDGLR